MRSSGIRSVDSLPFDEGSVHAPGSNGSIGPSSPQCGGNTYSAKSPSEAHWVQPKIGTMVHALTPKLASIERSLLEAVDQARGEYERAVPADKDLARNRYYAALKAFSRFVLCSEACTSL